MILGADIGTTITAQIVAFKVTRYALLLVAVGFVLLFVGKKDTTKHYGTLIMGLGMIFFGERPDAATWAGAGLIMASGLYMMWRERRSASA